MARVAALLTLARREAGLTQRALAQAADIPQASVSRIERGLISPRASTIERWLEACGRTLVMSPPARPAAERSAAAAGSVTTAAAGSSTVSRVPARPRPKPSPGREDAPSARDDAPSERDDPPSDRNDAPSDWAPWLS